MLGTINSLPWSSEKLMEERAETEQEPKGMEVTRRTKPTESAEGGPYKFTVTEAENTGPIPVFISFYVYML